mmetsp:Transcript_20675/g.33390  ORF Transcript_20675/g.33390 Transcript_20675/m.33390 type:complete len:174 (+) Transcript_20675:76-597(+)
MGTSKTECYYEILGVKSDASPRTIQRAWKRQALLHHPDKASDADKEIAEERFKEVAHAHDVLADPEQRNLYDLYGPSLKPSLGSFDFDCSRPPPDADVYEAEFLEALMRAMGARKRQTSFTAANVWDGVLGIGLLTGAAVVWWLLYPSVARWTTWALWQWRFLLHDLRRGRLR